jgi:hypothetical protein
VARWLTSAALLALLAAGCGQASEKSEPASSTPKPQTGSPRLVPIAQKPFRVKGSGFFPHERVRLEVSGSSAAAHTAVAGSRGSFTLTIPEIDACGSVTLTAKGSRGSRASFNFSQIACS